MKPTWLYWTLALIITLGAAAYQRRTGPTYPRRGTSIVDRVFFPWQLPRSADSDRDAVISIWTGSPEMRGAILWRRYRGGGAWNEITLVNEGGTLRGELPKQPPAGKLEYRVRVARGADEVWLGKEPLVMRFKGSVPTWVLVPHVVGIFGAMLISTLAGLMAFGRHPGYRRWAWVAFWLLLAGGMILGPVVQKYAFGELWTGVPWGWDLTDNKTLIGFIGWLAAVLANRKKERRAWVIFAALLLLVIFSIPHSMFGSELNYTTGKVTQG